MFPPEAPSHQDPREQYRSLGESPPPEAESRLPEEDWVDFEIDRREIPNAAVLSVRREVSVGELEGFIRSSVNELRGRGEEAAGAAFSIYHGRVDEEDGHNGPVEVCLPVREGTNGAQELLGGPAVVVRVPQGTTRFPEILQAHDAAYKWLADNGYDPSTPPREVYLTEDMSSIEIVLPFQEHDPGGM